MLGEGTFLSAEVLKSSIDPVEFVTAHNSVGGVAPSSVRRMIANRRRSLEECRTRQTQRIEKRENADRALREEVEAFLAKI